MHTKVENTYNSEGLRVHLLGNSKCRNEFSKYRKQGKKDDQHIAHDELISVMSKK